jgi:AraC-like DNA-binding protein
MALKDRLTPAMRDDLYNRRVTTKALAKQLGVSETHLSRVCPGKIPGQKRQYKTDLIESRKLYREELALEVTCGRLDRKKAIQLAGCSERTFWRHIANVRNHA